MNIDPAMFRAYDIRGIVDESLTEESVELIGQAIGSEAQVRGESRVVIGRDGRLSGPKLSKALATGLMKSGCDVIDIGAVPTPLLYFATHVLDTNSGVMLTGSHNPPNYNGLKVVLNGVTLANENITALYDRIVQNKLSQGHGTLTHFKLDDQYIEHICDDVRLKKPLKIVIDAGNGIGGAIAPALFRRLGCDVTTLFCEVDGSFPNHHPDPSIPKNLVDLIKKVREVGADVGLAFDGDADRLGVVTGQGEIILPDRCMILFARDVLSRNPGAKIIYDVKCSRNLREEIEKHRGEPIMSRTGHSFIKAAMQETGALLGGEMSGHVFFKERWFGFDDGLYAGVRLLEILSNYDGTTEELFATLPTSINTPELKLPIDDDKKFIFMDQFIKSAHFEGGKLNTLDGLRVDFSDGWGLVRPSNTTPCLVLRFEANTEAALNRIKELFRRELLKVNSALELPF